MSRARTTLLGFVLSLAAALLPSTGVCQDQDVRFRPLDIYVESDEAPIAAYQIELVVESGQAQIVGVEGGEHSAFKAAPHYDPKALYGGRIILAAYSTDAELPQGRLRLLTVHVRESGEAPSYALRLVVAADAKGEKLTPEVSIETRKGGR